MKWIIKIFQSFKVPDRILPVILRKGQDTIFHHIIRIRWSSSDIYQKIEEDTCMREVEKEDTTHPRFRRPFNITEFLLKTVGRAVWPGAIAPLLARPPYRQIYWDCICEEVRTGEIEDALMNKRTVVCALLDIEAAFGNTPQEAVKKALTRWEMRPSPLLQLEDVYHGELLSHSYRVSQYMRSYAT